MLWWLKNVKLVLFFLVISRLSLAANKAALERNDTIKRSFHGESHVSSYVTVTVPYENDDLIIARLVTDQLETTTDSANPRFDNQVSSSALETVLNRCLDRHLTLQFLGPFLIFTGLIGLLNGPLFGVKVLLFSIQFNIVFPTFVCFVTVCWTVFYTLVFCILVTMLLIVRNGLSQSRSSRTSWTLLRKFTFFESSYLFMKILWCYLGFFLNYSCYLWYRIVPFRVVFVRHLKIL